MQRNFKELLRFRGDSWGKPLEAAPIYRDSLLMSKEQTTSELFASDEDFAALVLLFLRNTY